MDHLTYGKDFTFIPVETWESEEQYREHRERYYGVKLACGHLPTRPATVYNTGVSTSTGYGTDPDTGEKYCYDCCSEREVAQAIRDGEGMFYLEKRDSITGPVYAVTTWPGNQVSGRVVILNRWTDNFGGDRVAFRCEFNGEIWTGSGPGEGQYCRIKRTKLAHL